MTRLYAVLIGVTLAAPMLDSAVYKGQKIYIKKCRVCHDGGEKVATLKTMKAWQSYFQNNGTNIAAAHVGNGKVAAQISALHAKGSAHKLTQERLEHYMLSSDFQSKSRHLRDFLVQYAKDSGNVPACN